MDAYAQIATKIIEQQETIIGPLAVEQAKKVKDLKVDWGSKHSVTLTKDGAGVIDELVKRFEELFGQVSVEVCKDATARLVAQLPADKQPKSLR